jgi:hypothetical protein
MLLELVSSNYLVIVEGLAVTLLRRFLLSKLYEWYGVPVLCPGNLAVTTTLRLLHQVPDRIHQLTVTVLVGGPRRCV